MNLTQVKALLDDYDQPYRVSRLSNPSAVYSAMGYHTQGDSAPIVALTVDNPRHEKNMMLTFDAEGNNPECIELFFGGYFYELEEWDEDQLPSKLKEYVEGILSGKAHIILTWDKDTGRWCGDGLYQEDAMTAFDREVQQIKSGASEYRGRICEIYNWYSLERIV